MENQYEPFDTLRAIDAYVTESRNVLDGAMSVNADRLTIGEAGRVYLHLTRALRYLEQTRENIRRVR